MNKPYTADINKLAEFLDAHPTTSYTPLELAFLFNVTYQEMRHELGCLHITLLYSKSGGRYSSPTRGTSANPLPWDGKTLQDPDILFGEGSGTPHNLLLEARMSLYPLPHKITGDTPVMTIVESIYATLKVNAGHYLGNVWFATFETERLLLADLAPHLSEAPSGVGTMKWGVKPPTTSDLYLPRDDKAWTWDFVWGDEACFGWGLEPVPADHYTKAKPKKLTGTRKYVRLQTFLEEHQHLKFTVKDFQRIFEASPKSVETWLQRIPVMVRDIYTDTGLVHTGDTTYGHHLAPSSVTPTLWGGGWADLLPEYRKLGAFQPAAVELPPGAARMQGFLDTHPHLKFTRYSLSQILGLSHHYTAKWSNMCQANIVVHDQDATASYAAGAMTFGSRVLNPQTLGSGDMDSLNTLHTSQVREVPLTSCEKIQDFLVVHPHLKFTYLQLSHVVGVTITTVKKHVPRLNACVQRRDRGVLRYRKVRSGFPGDTVTAHASWGERRIVWSGKADALTEPYRSAVKDYVWPHLSVPEEPEVPKPETTGTVVSEWRQKIEVVEASIKQLEEAVELKELHESLVKLEAKLKSSLSK